MLNSRTSVQASPCCPYIVLGVRRGGRRLGCSPKGAPFPEIPPSAFSSLLSEFGAHRAGLSRVSLSGIFSLSKSPRSLEVPSRLGLERRAWLRRGRGLVWPGGAGRAPGPGRRLERQQRRAGGTRRGSRWERRGAQAAAGLRGGGSGACGLHGASGVRLSSGGRIGPRLLLAMGDILSTHLDDARRQHIAGEHRSAPDRFGVPPGTPCHASDLAGRRRGSPRVKARVGAGAGQTLTLPLNLFPLGLDGSSRPFCVLPSPFEEPGTPFLYWNLLPLEPSLARTLHL